MLGIDHPPDDQWDASDAAPDTPQLNADAASQDRGTVLTDARARQEYALAYRAKVDAIYAAAEQRGTAETPADPPDSIHDTPDMADRYPDDYVPWTGSQRAVERPEALGDWLANTNPDMANNRGRRNNCGECARAVTRTWFGDAVTPAALADVKSSGEPTGRMSEWAGQKPVPASMTEIGRRLEELGAGSLAIVGFDRPGFGHWFNAVNQDGTILAVDGQTGKFGIWPPASLGSSFDESKMLRSDAIFFTSEGKVVRDDH
jgi:hypothetical protein